MAKTAKEHINTPKQEKVVILDKDFAGIKAGKSLFVGTPKLVDNYIKNIPFGQQRTIMRLKNELARKNKADAMCPVSTAIFIRISAQAAIDDINNGVALSKVTPFWRVLSSEDKISKKLAIDLTWLDALRQSEQSEA